MGVYGPAIAGINLVLIISSTVLLYFGNILIRFYLLPTIDFVTATFSSVPSLMLAVGGLGLFGGLFGIVVGATANRPGLIAHAVMLSLVFIVQLASIFTTAELRSQLQNSILDQLNFDLYDVATQYWQDPDFQDSWDELQRTYACCGFNGFNTGYQDWKAGSRNGLNTLKKLDSVPDSCCLHEMEDCGEGMISRLNAYTEIYTHGCLTTLKKRMATDIKPVLTAYLGCGVVLALLQIISIVLSSAYSAALTRRKKRDEERYTAVRGGGEKRSLYHFTDTAPLPAAQPTPIIRDSGLPSAAGSHVPSLAASGSRAASLAGSRKSVNATVDDDKVSQISSSSARREYRSSAYIEPSNERGTVI